MSINTLDDAGEDMRTCIVIPTFNRASLLPDVLAHLDKQTCPPAEVMMSAPDESHVVRFEPKNYTLSFVFGPRGSCAQRNRALAHALERGFDIIAFFDDDFLPADDYLEQLQAAFERNAGWAVITGTVIADGARGPGLSFEDGLAILRRSHGSRTTEELNSVIKHPGAYGCNMSVRGANVRELRFDERLVLYGWQEDIDFTSQLRRCGDIVEIGRLSGVHLGAKSGRVSGVRFGYSQVCNPVYLMLKGTMPASFGLELMARNLMANAVKSFWPEPYVDRRGRLRGNLIAALHLLRGRVQPEYVLKL